MSKKIDLEKQAAALQRMKEELGRLNETFDAAMKAAGVQSESDLEVDPEKLPPEMRAEFESVKAEAAKAGRNAAASLETETAAESAAPVRRTRRGAIAI